MAEKDKVWELRKKSYNGFDSDPRELSHPGGTHIHGERWQGGLLLDHVTVAKCPAGQ